MSNTIKNKSGQLTESRRRFLEKAGTSAALAMFGAAFFTSCSEDEDNTPTPPPNGGGTGNGITVAGNTVTIDLGIQNSLTNDGSWLLIIEAQTLVARVGGSFIALTSVCTHSACDRDWSYSNEEFTCTCHNSKFDTSGNVLQGPALLPLTEFATSVAGNTLTITK